MKAILLFGFLATITSCKAQNQNGLKTKNELTTDYNADNIVTELGNNIDYVLQDSRENYWFASNEEGLYLYGNKSKKLFHISDKDGLCSNFVYNVQEDINGNLWFSTRDGVCSFDGISFANFTETIKKAPFGTFQYKRGGLFFNHQEGLCYYDGKSFINFTIHPDTYKPDPTNMNRPYSVYSIFVDKSGSVWFGTQEKGVCRYDGKSFMFFTEEGLDTAAVRCIFQDWEGNLWFGNNGAGLFRYDGKKITNFSIEKGLGNSDFLKKKKIVDKPGTIGRVWAINDDKDGNLWIGTIDAGVWKYDGNKLTNYTIKDGLTGNSIWGIFKNKNGELLFVTDGDTICKFNGRSFTEFLVSEK
ncbi:MAG TPA: two-component regulator propeller domain-containing protein [Flavobacterium sp.]|uniref:ligand-binding sensor domain-containing protein n=1 Tax=Flavobacterium sp. TaxID=239 RepID=UPI002CF7294A|nr:two-component regulator propeller domain-containing protein [Flavobacterium sp.]HSD14164.1 two-component regulator propeller domain-containing protein [Flavobacterium sp.]